MQISKLTLAAFLISTGSAHAQFGMSPMMNPMSMMGPMTMMAPMGMMGMGMMGGGMGGGMNPMSMMAPMGMMAAPMMMPMGSSMMSAQMYQPQSMMNPYLNPMAANNPYLNPSAGKSNPFMMMQPAAPAYGGYGRPAAPTQAAPMSFFPVMPSVNTGAQSPQAPATSAPATAAKSGTPAPVSSPFDPAMWMQMMGGMTPATSTTPAASTPAK